MSCGKIRSEGYNYYVPFSWEEKPGVPKIIHQKSSSDIVGLMNPLKDQLSDDDVAQPAGSSNLAPPPPGVSQPPPSWKSFSRQGPRWRDDPFLAALKSCTKTASSGYEELRKKGKSLKGKSSSVFSCKYSCNVESDNLVRISKLPPLPKERYSVRSFVRNTQ